MNLPYLVQRCTILHSAAATTQRFAHVVSTDYMGSAEFEFGALPKSLRAIAGGSYQAIKSISKGKAPLWVFSILTAEEMVKYTEYLAAMWVDKNSIHLKEYANFKERHSSSADDYRRSNYTTLTDLWWDIENHVMWSFNESFIRRLPHHIAASIMHMDMLKALQQNTPN